MITLINGGTSFEVTKLRNKPFRSDEISHRAWFHALIQGMREKYYHDILLNALKIIAVSVKLLPWYEKYTKIIVKKAIYLW